MLTCGVGREAMRTVNSSGKSDVMANNLCMLGELGNRLETLTTVSVENKPNKYHVQ